MFAALGKLESETLFRSPYYRDSYDFPYNPDDLASGNNYRIYDEMRHDDQVKAAVTLKKDMVLNSGWELVGPSREANQFVEQSIAGVGGDDPMEPGFSEAVASLLASGYEYGFGMGEVLHRPPGESKSGMWELRSIRVRPPHSFLFRLDEYGNVQLVQQFTDRGIKDLDPGIFLHYPHQADYGNPYGRSDLRSAFPAWKAKKFLFRMAMRYAERFAGSTAVGRYDGNMNSAEIAALRTMLESLADSSTLVFPKDAEVEFVQTARDSSETYNKLLLMLNMWIARSLLVPDLLGISGNQTTGGSYSLGREHFRVFTATIASDKVALARRITAKVVRPLVQANFGDVGCEFRFKPIEIGDESEYLRLWVDAVNGQVFRPNEDEVNHFRSKVGFPQGEVKVPEPVPAVAAPAEPALAPQGEFARQLSQFERKMDFAAIAKGMDASDADAHREVSRILKRMADDLLERARDRGLIEKFKPEALGELEPKFLRELNSAIKGGFLAVNRRATEQARKEVLPDEPRQFISEDVLPDEFEMLVRAEAYKLAGDLSMEVKKRVSTSMFRALKDGTPIAKLARELDAEFAKYTEGQLRNILRTKNTEIFNGARRIFFETDEVASGLVVGYMHSSVMDEVTTEVCQRLDGRVWERSEMRPDLVPPLHWNCRSVHVPITRLEVGRDHKFQEAPKDSTLRSWGANLIAKEA